MVNVRDLKFHVCIPHEKIVDPYFYVPPTEGGGHIVFGAVPVGVGVGVGVRVRVASFLRDIF